jgi:hypothetical protein
MGKQVLQKCLNDKPQSEQQMWTSLFTFSLFHLFDKSNPEERVGKVNRPKSSVNREEERIKTMSESGARSKLR